MEIVTHHPRLRVSYRSVERVVSVCAAALLPGNFFMSLALLTDKEMTRINEKYTGRQGSTDVLAFSLGSMSNRETREGEILISLDRANKQAKMKDVRLVLEVTRLIVHAMVHLAGFDHHDLESFKEMRRREFSLLLKCL